MPKIRTIKETDEAIAALSKSQLELIVATAFLGLFQDMDEAGVRFLNLQKDVNGADYIDLVANALKRAGLEVVPRRPRRTENA